MITSREQEITIRYQNGWQDRGSESMNLHIIYYIRNNEKVHRVYLKHTRNRVKTCHCFTRAPNNTDFRVMYRYLMHLKACTHKCAHITWINTETCANEISVSQFSAILERCWQESEIIWGMVWFINPSSNWLSAVNLKWQLLIILTKYLN